MQLFLTRYYGDANITKSTLSFKVRDRTVLTCEAREAAYRDYSEPFPRHSFYCLPTGTHRCYITSTANNRFCLRLVGVPGHKGNMIYIDPERQLHVGAILIGYASSSLPPKWRKLIDHDALKKKYAKLLEDQMYDGEPITIEVRNEVEK